MIALHPRAAPTSAPSARRRTRSAAPPAAALPGAVEPGWGRVLRVSVARAVARDGRLAGDLVAAPRCSLGWTPRVILSGSMEPRIHVGDVIVTREVPAASLAKGQVITVTDPDHPGKTRTHRVVRREADGRLVLKGDANREADSSHVSPSTTCSVSGVVRVPFVGRPAYWMAERNWLALGRHRTLPRPGASCTVLRDAQAEDSRTRTQDEDTGPAPAPDGRAAASSASAARVAASPRRSPSLSSPSAPLAGPADAAFKKAVGNPVSTASTRPRTSTPTAPQVARRLAVPLLEARRDQRHRHRRRRHRQPATGRCSPRPTRRGRPAPSPPRRRHSARADRSASITANAVGGRAEHVSASRPGSRPPPPPAAGSSASATPTGQNPLDHHRPPALPGARTARCTSASARTKTTVASGSAINNGAWHHVVGTYTTGTNGMKLYVDGAYQGQATATPVDLHRLLARRCRAT